MKVQVTMDLTPDQRIGIGLIQSGLFVPAKTVDIRKYLSNQMQEKLDDIGKDVATLRLTLRDELVAKLNVDERSSVIGLPTG